MKERKDFMNISIREYIKNNFKDSNIKEIEDSINSSIESKEEVTLPGLGVFFEILWENSESKMKENILDVLQNSI